MTLTLWPWPLFYYRVRRCLSVIFVLISVTFYPAVKKKQKQTLTITALIIPFKFHDCGKLIKVKEKCILLWRTLMPNLKAVTWKLFELWPKVCFECFSVWRDLDLWLNFLKSETHHCQVCTHPPPKKGYDQQYSRNNPYKKIFELRPWKTKKKHKKTPDEDDNNSSLRILRIMKKTIVFCAFKFDMW